MASVRCQVIQFIYRQSFSRSSAFASQKVSSVRLKNFENSGIKCLHSGTTRNTKLAEVGKLEPVRIEGNYDTGQMFLHRLFGYRGVVLFPWHAKVYDRDMDKIIPHGEKFPNTTTYPKTKFTQKEGNDKKELKGRSTTYYQVLIDQRDWSHTSNRAQTESVTFLKPENTRNLYALPGLDYVAHDDILPYSTSDKSPIQHELFEVFSV